MGATEEDVQVAVAKYKAHFPEWRLDSFPGFLGNVMAGRCANVFNLDGMNCVVDAACASSLIAVKVAIDERTRTPTLTRILTQALTLTLTQILTLTLTLALTLSRWRSTSCCAATARP